MNKTQWKVETEGATEYVESEHKQLTDVLSFFNVVDGERDIVAEFKVWHSYLRLTDSEEYVVVPIRDLKPLVMDVIKQDLAADGELVELLCAAITCAKQRGVDL